MFGRARRVPVSFTIASVSKASNEEMTFSQVVYLFFLVRTLSFPAPGRHSAAIKDASPN